MTWFTIKRSPLDKVFSEYIRERDEWTCQRCHVDLNNFHGLLDNSHYIGRGNKATRWDEENCVAFCKACHKYMGDANHRKEYEEFMIKRLGEERHDLLLFRSRLNSKQLNMDEGILLMFYKSWLEGRNQRIIGHRP